MGFTCCCFGGDGDILEHKPGKEDATERLSPRVHSSLSKPVSFFEEAGARGGDKNASTKASVPNSGGAVEKSGIEEISAENQMLKLSMVDLRPERRRMLPSQAFRTMLGRCTYLHESTVGMSVK